MSSAFQNAAPAVPASPYATSAQGSARFQITPETFRNRVRKGSLPKPVLIAPRKNLWLISELDEAFEAQYGASHIKPMVNSTGA